MNTRFRESFAEDLSTIADAGRLRWIKRVIEQVEAARTFQQIPNLKRLDAKCKYDRIRVGDYRVGFVFEHGAVTFVRCLDRKEICRYFPWTTAEARTLDSDFRIYRKHRRQPILLIHPDWGLVISE